MKTRLRAQTSSKWHANRVTDRDYDDAHLNQRRLRHPPRRQRQDLEVAYRFMADELANRRAVALGRNYINRLCNLPKLSSAPRTRAAPVAASSVTNVPTRCG